MKYGVKLDPRNVNDPRWQERFGQPAWFFWRAREYGLGFVEFTLPEAMDPAEVARLGRLAWREGLSSAIHPYFYGALAAEVFDRADPAGFLPVFELAEELGKLSGTPTPLVFHAGRANGEPHRRPPDKAAAAAGEFLRWAGGQTRKAYPHVRVLCETAMPVFHDSKGEWDRLADTYDTCLDLAAAAGVDICWDFGHTFGSVRQGKHPKFPPVAFLRRVGHVHAHDTVQTESGPVDHRPLGEGLCPWRQYCRILAEHGYDGDILFEVGLTTVRTYEGLKEMVGFGVSEIEAIFTSSRR